jgi:hypothetical protein
MRALTRRWGRNGESGSEDPYALGEFAVAWTRGFQQAGTDRPYAGVVTLKHWDANSLEGCKSPSGGHEGCNHTRWTRHNFDVNISKAALTDTYLRHFRAAVIDGGAKGMMCSCAPPPLLLLLCISWRGLGSELSLRCAACIILYYYNILYRLAPARSCFFSHRVCHAVLDGLWRQTTLFGACPRARRGC